MMKFIFLIFLIYSLSGCFPGYPCGNCWCYMTKDKDGNSIIEEHWCK